jgi:eukaryotic-like serine/threonine-protein kinase
MTTPTQIGRFQVGRKLGAGNQGTVYLCHDSELERKVAVKLLDKSLPVASFHDEARTVSKLQHLNIVSIFEAGHHQGMPYLVFEYVDGKLLSSLIRGQPLELARAVQIFQGLLEGMTQAHKAGIVHRDLKPTNIVINNEQVPKIMDFGIARPLSEVSGPDRRLIGTPRYLAPECIRDGTVAPQADVFALGSIFYEMLTGAPAFNGTGQQAVIDAILKTCPTPPSQFNGAVTEKLDRFVLKALEKDPVLRYADAGEMLQAFNEARRAPGAAPKPRDDASGTVEFLLRRMERQSDFPALSQSVRSINAMSYTGDKDVNQIAGIIVKDFALTNKILKVVNSAYYGRFSGRIGTVSRAVIVLGIETIRSLVASLIFFEHIKDKAHADHLRDLMSSAMFRATLAHRVAAVIDREQVEEYFLSGLLSELGRILVAFYLPEESRAIEQFTDVEGRRPFAAQHCVLGVTFEKIGMEIAAFWNFPRELIDSMKCWEDGQKPINRTERKRLVNAFAHDVVRAIIVRVPGDPLIQAVLVEKYAGALALHPNRIPELVHAAVDEFLEVAEALATDVPRAFAKKLAAALVVETPDIGPGPVLDRDGLEETLILDDEGTERANTGESRPPAADTLPDPETLLMDGLQEVTNMLAGTQSVSEVFSVVLETMYRAIGFQRVVLALVDSRTGDVFARASFGDAGDAFMRRFRFPSAYSADIFHGALKNVVDIYVADCTSEKIQSDIPEWYRKLSHAGSFMVFPLVINNRPVGLIYADHARPRGLNIDKKRLDLLKALRNQILLALKYGA